MRVLPDPNRPRGRAKVYLPYAPFVVAPTIPLAVVRVAVDDADVTSDAVDVSRCRVRPHVVAEWAEVACELEVPDVGADIARAARLGDDGAAVEMVGRVRCRPSRYRRSVRFRRVEGRGWRGTLALRRADLSVLVDLDVFAVRAADPSERADAVAPHAGSFVAVSPRWALEESPVEIRAAGAFDVAYVDFSEPQPDGPYRGEDAAHLRRVPTALCHVAFRPEGPLVLVNRHRPELVDVMLSKGTIGTRARMRDVLLRHVATVAWRSILTEAAVRVALDAPGLDDEAPLMGEEHWTTRVLARAAKESHPKSEAPIDDLIEDLRDEGARPGLLTSLAERLGRVGEDPFARLFEQVANR